MNKNIRNKLESQNGVSILFALLLMMVAAMVSTVIVSASLTAVKRTKAKKDNMQEMVSLDSAALLLRDEITKTDGYQLIQSGNATDGNRYQWNDTNEGTFIPEISQISVAYANSDTASATGTFEIVTAASTADGKLDKSDKVSVSYSLTASENGGKGNFKLTSEDGATMYVPFTISLTDNRVSWVYNGAGLEESK